jgi:hypothetical protein
VYALGCDELQFLALVLVPLHNNPFTTMEIVDELGSDVDVH